MNSSQPVCRSEKGRKEERKRGRLRESRLGRWEKVKEGGILVFSILEDLFDSSFYLFLIM